MPGITFYYNTESFSSIGKDAIDDSLESLLFTERYSLTNFIEEKNYFVTCTKYPEYPSENFRTDKYLIIIEGKIYNKSQGKLKEELERLAETIFDKSNENKENLTKWLNNADGEFIIVIHNLANKQIAIFNDSLGRLALYSYQSDFILSTLGNHFVILPNKNSCNFIAPAFPCSFTFILSTSLLIFLA